MEHDSYYAAFDVSKLYEEPVRRPHDFRRLIWFGIGALASWMLFSR